MKVVVLGAGVIGVTTAWFLKAAGHDVTVVERQQAAAMETSFANGSQISVCHAEPWANPAAPKKILKWLGRENAPLLFRLRPSFRQWVWGLQFLQECRPANTAHNIAQIIQLATYSRATLRELRNELHLQYDQLTHGILHFYTDRAEFKAAWAVTEQMQRLGCDRQVVGPKQCVDIEPALAASRQRLVGGTYTSEDESGDAHLFTQALSAKCAEAGVQFRYETQVCALDTRRELGFIDGVVVMDRHGQRERLEADAYIVALGSYTPLLLRRVGVRTPIYPVKGYSATLPLSDASYPLSVSMTDDERKVVYTRLGERIRIAGTAEMAGYNLSLNPTRCQALVERFLDLFPDAPVHPSEAVFWCGLRPATPGNVPIIGGTRYPNLYINSGHGTLGWTMAAGSGKLLAAMVSGQKPDVAFAVRRC